MILDDPELPGSSARALRRIPRALARRRFRPGAGARRAGRAAARPAAAGHVGDARRRARREAARRRAGDRERGPQLSRSSSAIASARPGTPIEDAMAQGDPRRACRGEPAACSPSCPASARSSAPPSGWRAGVGGDVDVVPLYGQLDGKAQDAAIRPRRRPAQGRAGDLDRRDVDHHRRRARRHRLRPVAPAEIRAGDGADAAGDGARVARFRRPARRPRRAHAAGHRDPAVARRADAALPAFTPPEILEADLSGLLLDCAAFGVADPATLSFLDPPPGRRWRRRAVAARDLGAIDARRSADRSGRGHARLALPVRLAHMVAEAANGQALDAALLAVLLTERGLGRRRCRSRAPAVALPSTNARRARARRGSSPKAPGATGRAEASRPHGQGILEAPPQGGEGTAGALLLHAWPDRVAKARGERGRFVLANGSGAMLDAADPLAGETFLVVADLQGKAQNARIAAAAADHRGRHPGQLSASASSAARRRRLFDPKNARCGCARRRVSARSSLPNACCPPRPATMADRAILDAMRAHGLACCRGRRRRNAAPPFAMAASGASANHGRTCPTKRCSPRSTTGCCPSSAGEASFARIDGRASSMTG
jgi:ATP-dependent helicase HrpB